MMSIPRADRQGRRHLTALTAAQAAGQTGSWTALVIALPLALSRPDPPLWLALITGAWAGPAVLAPAAGRLIDRDSPHWHGPRSAGAVAWALAAACTIAPALSRHLAVTVAALALLSALRGIAVSTGDAAPTWLPHRPDLTRARSWLVIAAALPLLAGPLGAATILTAAGPRAAWLITGALFAVAAVITATVPAVHPGREPGPDARPPLTGRYLAVLLMVAVVWLSYGAMEVNQPYYVTRELRGTLITYGWTMVTFAVGAVLMALVIYRLDRLTRSRWAIPAAAVLAGAGEFAFSGTRSVLVALAGSGLWGAGAAAFNAACGSAIAMSVPKAAHGRAMAWWRSVQAAADFLPALFIGQVTVAAGLRLVLAGTSAVAIAAGLACLAATALAVAITAARYPAAARASEDQAASRRVARRAPGPGLIRQAPVRAMTAPDGELGRGAGPQRVTGSRASGPAAGKPAGHPAGQAGARDRAR
jgi:MFS family permease